MSRVLIPQNWQLPSRGVVIEFLESLRFAGTDAPARRYSLSVMADLSSRIAPIDLYCYLKHRFGPPNGFAMSLRDDSVNNFIHWNYTLSVDGYILDISGLNVRTEIRIYSPETSDETLPVEEVEDNLLKQFAAMRTVLGAQRDSLEKWTLFVNPYARLKTIVERSERRLREIDLKHVSVPELPDQSESGVKAYIKALRQCQVLYSEAMELTFQLQLAAPILCEAAVNLILLTLARSDVKADRRIYDDFLRRQIDVRVKSLHLHCNGFVKAVAAEDKHFKQFQRLIAKRNNNLHGNVDPTRGTSEPIYFDQRTIPLVQRHRNLSELALSNILAEAVPDEALEDIEVAHQFIKFVVSHVDDHLRPTLEMLMERRQIGYRPKDGMLGDILPQADVEVFPILGEK